LKRQSGHGPDRHPSLKPIWTGPEFYFAVISGKKLSKKQVAKIYKDFYKDD